MQGYTYFDTEETTGSPEWAKGLAFPDQDQIAELQDEIKILEGKIESLERDLSIRVLR